MYIQGVHAYSCPVSNFSTVSFRGIVQIVKMFEILFCIILKLIMANLGPISYMKNFLHVLTSKTLKILFLYDCWAENVL